MHSEAAEISKSVNFSAKSKKLGIILLTDNRNLAPVDKASDKDLKGSVCKCM